MQKIIFPSRARLGAAILVVVLLPSHSFLQAPREDLAVAYPGAAGVYELSLPGQNPIRMQVYFKGGTLRTLEGGESTATIWNPVEDRNGRFTAVSPKRGTFQLEWLNDEQGRRTRFRVVNETLKMDVTAVKKAEIDDAKGDPASASDRQGYCERHYRKSEHLVPMRDGVRLLTQVFIPIDSSEPHPILFMRTPYGLAPYGEEMSGSFIPLYFARENYIFVQQDVRGTGMSEGNYEYHAVFKKDKTSPAVVDESSDAYDTIDWLLKNVPGHNGKVGVWGVSYAGFTAAMAAVAAHPAVVAVSPQAPMADMFAGDDGHHLGALYLAHYANYLYSMGQVRKEPTAAPLPRFRFPTPDGYSFFLRLGPLRNITEKMFSPDNKPWNDTMAHETYDAYWKAHSIYPHLRGIRPAVLTVGGWYDAEDLHGTLGTYKTIERENPGLRNTLVMGPWAHGRWNPLSGGNESRGVFAFKGAQAYYWERVELPFFNYHLKGKGAPDLPEALVFETGTDRWRTFSAWPPAEAVEKTLFLGGGGRASFDPVAVSEEGFDEFVSDPAKPVPYTAQTTPTYFRDYFVEDQRFAASRPDVLVYAGDPLAEDVTVAGPIRAELYVTTTGTDADWVVKVIDVYPDNAPDPAPNPGAVRMGGYQRLIRGEVLRGKFRGGYEKPEPFVPGRVTKVEFELPDVQHAFRKGHRIMVQIQSSWFPLIDRNPQTFCNIRTARESDFRKATHRVYRTRQYPSGVRMKIVAG